MEKAELTKKGLSKKPYIIGRRSDKFLNEAKNLLIFNDNWKIYLSWARGLTIESKRIILSK